MSPRIPEKTVDSLVQYMQAKEGRSAEEIAATRLLLNTQLADPTHPFYHQVASSLKQRWCNVICGCNSNSQEEEIHPEILKLTDRHASSLRRIIALHKKVHLLTYNRIIREKVEDRRWRRSSGSPNKRQKIV